MAELWQADLIRGLLWHRCIFYCRNKISKIRLLEYRGKSSQPSPVCALLIKATPAPSWSWATTNLTIQFPHRNIISNNKVEVFMASVLEAATTPTGLDSFGPVSHGYIKIVGYLRPNQYLAYDSQSRSSLLASSPDAFDAYDYEYEESGLPSSHGTLLFALTRWPTRTSNGSTIRGLILKPTGLQHDEYRRVGTFAMNLSARRESVDLEVEDVALSTITIV